MSAELWYEVGPDGKSRPVTPSPGDLTARAKWTAENWDEDLLCPKWRAEQIRAAKKAAVTTGDGAA